MTPGDIVLYSCAGQEHKALVLYAHSGQPAHLGANGEPLLHLAFIAPERESAIERAKFGYIPRIWTEFDVVHHSQAFSEQFKRDNGLLTPAQIAAVRGQGEWTELIVSKPENIAFVLPIEPPAEEPAPPLDEVPVPAPADTPEPEPDSAPKEQ